MLISKLVIVTLPIAFIIGQPEPARAQRSTPAGVSIASASHAEWHQTAILHVGGTRVSATRADSSGGLQPGVLGAIVGASVGGFLGYKWELGLCEVPASQCRGTAGAIGGVVIGAAVGFVLDWGLRGLRD